MEKDMNDEPKGLSETVLDDITTQFGKLGLQTPTGVCILPTNVLYAENQSDLFRAPSSPDLKVLFRQAGITVDKLEPEGVKIPYRDDRDSTLIMPLVFIGAAYLSGNANALNVALGVLANYVTDYFRGKAGSNRVKCSVVVEKTDKKTTKKIEYDGAPEEFGQLIEAIGKALK